MYHEFTHQIFHVFSGGNKSQAWVTEGIAIYTESPSWNAYGDLVLGATENAQRARSYMRDFAAGRHLPLDRLMAITRPEWSASTDPGKQYDAAGALAQFCMEAEARKFRQDYVDYLRDAYRGTAKRPLWEYMGLDQADFVGRFEVWLKAGSGEARGA